MFVLVMIPGAEVGQRIGAVTLNRQGYYETALDSHQTETSAAELVTQMNAARGISTEVAESALAGSMFGWHCPAARLAKAFLSRSSETIH